MEGALTKLDPRTRMGLGLLAVAAILVAESPWTMLAELAFFLAAVSFMGAGRRWLRSLRAVGPMVALVFVIALISFDLESAFSLSLRLMNLLTASFALFQVIQPDEMGDSLRKLGLPHALAFILTTAMRYAPLLDLKLQGIMDAQRSRGIDLRLRPRNLRNLAALLMPLLAQSLAMAEELAMAMESRGFGREGRSFRRVYCMAVWEYGVMIAAIAAVAALAWLERA